MASRSALGQIVVLDDLLAFCHELKAVRTVPVGISCRALSLLNLNLGVGGVTEQITCRVRLGCGSVEILFIHLGLVERPIGFLECFHVVNL